MKAKVGDTVKFKRRFIEMRRRDFAEKPNLEKIIEFFQGEHKLIEIRSGTTAVVSCPRELGIGRAPGIYRHVMEYIYPCKKSDPCKCEWAHCRVSKHVEDISGSR